MKKFIIILLSIFLIVGCQKKEEEKLPTEFYTSYNSIDIKLGTLFNNLLVTLDEYNSSHKEQSNYYDGEATIYEYDTFEIETFLDNNVEKIYSIMFTSDEQLTNEGLRIGDSKEKMINVYKDDYYNPIDNVFIYKLSNTNLSFTLENDIIIGIVYYLS